MNVNHHSNNMNDVPHGIIYLNDKRVEELNERIHGRIKPDKNVILKPNFDIRSVPTRNCLIFPILDLKDKNHGTNTLFNSEEGFAPIQTKGPFVNYVQNIDKETQLRNQNYALQRGADQSVYVPSSTSDLYNNVIPISSINIEQPFHGLFERNRNFVTTQNNFVNNFQIGRDIFHNNTKVQLRTNTNEYR